MTRQSQPLKLEIIPTEKEFSEVQSFKYTADPYQRIYLRAAKSIPYGKVAEIMAAVTTAGYKKVALVTEPDKH